MIIMFFDTETNGLPKDWRAPMAELENWPRVIQLAWELYHVDDRTAPRSWGNHLIYPLGWTVPAEQFWIEHNFSTERSLKEGKDIGWVLDLFLGDLQSADYLVSHNMDFDYNVTGAECIRTNRSSQKRVRRLCTKELSTEYCRIPFPGQKRYSGRTEMRYKWPTLDELHRFLFSKPFEDAHDAMGDVRAMKDCFFELVNRKVITLKPVADGAAADQH